MGIIDIYRQMYLKAFFQCDKENKYFNYRKLFTWPYIKTLVFTVMWFQASDNHVGKRLCIDAAFQVSLKWENDPSASALTWCTHDLIHQLNVVWGRSLKPDICGVIPDTDPAIHPLSPPTVDGISVMPIISASLALVFFGWRCYAEVGFGTGRTISLDSSLKH